MKQSTSTCSIPKRIDAPGINPWAKKNQEKNVLS